MGCCANLSDATQWAAALQQATESSVDQRSSPPDLTVVSDLELVSGSRLSRIQQLVGIWKLVSQLSRRGCRAWLSALRFEKFQKSFDKSVLAE